MRDTQDATGQLLPFPDAGVAHESEDTEVSQLSQAPRTRRRVQPSWQPRPAAAPCPAHIGVLEVVLALLTAPLLTAALSAVGGC